ncbi:MAG: T9SS type A sorting domain-containing protein, partial [Bacteroidota bacterium]
LEPIEESVRLKAWPNPISDQLNLHLETDRSLKASLLLYNLQGQIVREIPVQVYQAGQHQLRLGKLDKLSAGIYQYRLVSDRGNVAGLIIKR